MPFIEELKPGDQIIPRLQSYGEVATFISYFPQEHTAIFYGTRSKEWRYIKLESHQYYSNWIGPCNSIRKQNLQEAFETLRKKRDDL